MTKGISFTLLFTILMNRHLAEPLTKGSEQSATMIFVGDISFDGPVRYFVEQQRTCNYNQSFSRVADLLKNADLRVGNLESPFVKSASKTWSPFEGKSVHNSAATRAVLGLKSVDFDVMQLANNHIVDYGTQGLNYTMKTLKAAGIQYVGVRVGSKKRQKPLIKTIRGIKIGFLSYCMNKEGCEAFEENSKSAHFSNIFHLGPIVFSNDIAAMDIRDLKRKVDIVVVLMHWSKELSLIPPLGIRDIARSLSIFGANLIIGTHPHVIQGHECTGANTLTVYSLGNFLLGRHGVDFTKFNGATSVKEKDVKKYIQQMNEVYNPTQMGYMFRITVTKHGIESAGYIPFEIENEPKNNCLQPVPKTKKWQRACGDQDLYCLDFRDVYTSNGADLKEHLDTYDLKIRSCINAN